MTIKNKKNRATNILIVVAILCLIGILYTASGSRVGIGVSCDKQKIINFRIVPPPFMSIAQPEICKVKIVAKSDAGEVICSKKVSILNFEKGVVPCNELKKHINEDIEINATFYDTSGNEIGEDFKILKYGGK